MKKCSRIFYVSILFFVILSMIGITSTEAAVEEFVDQEQLSFNSGPYLSDQWQSFTAGISAYISKVSVYGTIGSETTLSIYEGEGTSGANLQSQTVPVHFTQEWIDIVIENPVMINAGSQYTLRFQASSDNNLWWDTTNPYPGGRHSYNAPAGQDLAFKTYMLTKLTKTLVVFLTKDSGSDVSNLSGVKQALNNELYSNIEKMSFGRASLDVTYAGPYIGDIPYCVTNTNNKGAAIVNHAVNSAYGSGIDVTQYENFIALRNVDFSNDDCFDPGTGGMSNNIQYGGGTLTAGVSTIAYPRSFTDTSFGQEVRRTVHEFLHGYGQGTG